MSISSTRIGIEKPAVLPLPAASDIAPGFGHNWNDTAFKGNHNRRQMLEAELRGKLPPNYAKNFIRDREESPDFRDSTSILRNKLTQRAQNSSTATAEIAPIADATPGVLDEQVLRFHAYFVEECRESAAERRRTRKVAIKAFPYDDTFLIEAPRVANNGLQSGTILKRQRVPLSGLSTEQFLRATSINVGQDVAIYGITYHIYGCDAFTRSFLSGVGVDVGTDAPEPDDEYMTSYRAERIEGKRQGPTFESRDLSITMESLASKGKSASRYPDDLARCKKFFEDSGKVARFNAYWMDFESEAKGRFRVFEVRCFIEDSTISITERRAEGAPSDAIAKSFLSRRRLPISGSSAPAVSLTFSGRANGQREAVLPENDGYYGLKELSVGGTLNAFGREFFLFDCDAFTRDYYLNELNIRQPDAVDVRGYLTQPIQRPTIVPPPTGFGTPEDSLASCKSLVLKPPRKDNSGWLEFGGELLRFELQLLRSPDDVTADVDRLFVLTYYLEDGEIMITESAQRNSGFTGGKFLRKQRVRKAAGEQKSSFYGLEDLAIDNIINVHGFKFQIVRGDERTTAFLRARAPDAPPVDGAVSGARVAQLLQALREFIQVRFPTITEAFRSFDKDKDGYISADELRNLLQTNQVTRKVEEADAVARTLDVRGSGKLSYAAFVEAIGNARPASADGLSAAQAAHARTAAAEVVRQRALLALREKLEARCMTTFEMFRMFAVLPREPRTPAAVTSAASLANGTKETRMVPSQMRRGIHSVLGLTLTDDEMSAVLRTYFPALSVADVGTAMESSMTLSITLNDFSQKMTQVHALRQLPSQ